MVDNNSIEQSVDRAINDLGVARRIAGLMQLHARAGELIHVVRLSEGRLTFMHGFANGVFEAMLRAHSPGSTDNSVEVAYVCKVVGERAEGFKIYEPIPDGTEIDESLSAQMANMEPRKLIGIESKFLEKMGKAATSHFRNNGVATR